MKTLILILITLNISASANDINIDFGCYDCKKTDKFKLTKEPTKYKEKSKLKKDIEISADIRFRLEEIKKEK